MSEDRDEPDRNASPDHDGETRLAVVVDDDVVTVMHTIALLEDIGFKSLSALNRDQALEYLATYGDEASVLVTDVQMPGHENGLALAREVAARWPHIIIMVVSGIPQMLKSDLPDGATFVRKPLSAQIVRNHLRQVMPSSRQPHRLRR